MKQFPNPLARNASLVSLGFSLFFVTVSSLFAVGLGDLDGALLARDEKLTVQVLRYLGRREHLDPQQLERCLDAFPASQDMVRVILAELENAPPSLGHMAVAFRLLLFGGREAERAHWMVVQILRSYALCPREDIRAAALGQLQAAAMERSELHGSVLEALKTLVGNGVKGAEAALHQLERHAAWFSLPEEDEQVPCRLRLFTEEP